MYTLYTKLTWSVYVKIVLKNCFENNVDKSQDDYIKVDYNVWKCLSIKLW